MTEEEWLSAKRPVQLIDFIFAKLSVRRQRLIAIGSCETIPSEILGDDGARWLATVGRLAEKPDVKITWKLVRKWSDEFWRGQYWSVRERNLSEVFFQVGLGNLRPTLVNVASFRGTAERNNDFEDEAIAYVVREIVSNPFRPVTFLPEWRTSTILALATGIYEEKAFDRMPILADALQDANCDNDEILNHCRGPGPHVRGCFLIDLILGKQ